MFVDAGTERGGWAIVGIGLVVIIYESFKTIHGHSAIEMGHFEIATQLFRPLRSLTSQSTSVFKVEMFV